jgi:four helix bundle protein
MVWRKSHQFVLSVYQATRQFPKDEQYELTKQLRRAAVSVPANIAEGFIKRGTADKLRFMNIAQGSLEECRYYLILATDLGFADLSALQKMVDECARTLEAYARGIRTSAASRLQTPAS